MLGIRNFTIVSPWEMMGIYGKIPGIQPAMHHIIPRDHSRDKAGTGGVVQPNSRKVC